MLIVVVFVFTNTALGQAYDVQMDAQPAQFTDRNNSLQNRIQFPNIAGEVYVRILCNGFVDERGRLIEQVTCLSDKQVDAIYKPQATIQRPTRSIEVDSDVNVTDVTAFSANWIEERFEREVVEAARRSKIQPAKYEGRNRPAYINFSVVFEQTSTEKNIGVYLHHFRNADFLGDDYIAAQRIGYLMETTDYGRPFECELVYNPIIIGLTVHQDGIASDVQLDDILIKTSLSKGFLDTCVPAYLNLVNNSFYIPAYSNGEFVASYHSDIYYDQPVTEHAAEDSLLMGNRLSSWIRSGYMPTPKIWYMENYSEPKTHSQFND